MPATTQTPKPTGSRLPFGHTALTAPLRSELSRVLPSRPFSLRFWDGSVLAATTDAAPEFHLRDSAAIAHFLRSPGELGLGRAYVTGDIAVDDLDAAFGVVDSWDAPAISLADRARLTATAVVAAGLSGIPKPPAIELALTGNRHTPERDAEAIRYHYDVGNEFFALFLDESMTYSCAIFSRGATTLEEAQFTKLDLVASKLELKAGDRVLDVGCGWGSFAMHAAKHYDVNVLGITLSERQAELAKKRVADAGLSDRIEIRLQDYRTLTGEYDAISSIGMVEHVGDNQIDVYAKTLADLLAPGGRLLNHGIAVLDPDHDLQKDAFSNRYVFPDGEPLPLSRVTLAVERSGLLVRHVEGFGPDYAQTLREWIARLDQNTEEAERVAGADRLRVWRLYLRAARNGFEVGFTDVYQVLARRV